MRNRIFNRLLRIRTFLIGIIALTAITLAPTAHARSGLFPVVAKDALSAKLVRPVQRAVIRLLVLSGLNPPGPPQLGARLNELVKTDRARDTESLVSVGKSFGLDTVIAISIRSYSEATEATVRLINVKTGEEEVLTVTAEARRLPRKIFDALRGKKASSSGDDADLAAVEQALRKDQDRLYRRYLKKDDPKKPSFAGYVYRRAQRGKRLGLSLALTAPTLLAAGTIALGLTTADVWKDPPPDSSDDDDDSVNYGEGLEYAIVVLARIYVTLGLVVGCGVSAAAAAVGVLTYWRNKRKMQRLTPLLGKPEGRSSSISLTAAPFFTQDGGGLSLLVRF